MNVDRVTTEVLETPVERPYEAGGSVIQSHWHVLTRVYTADGVQGVGFAVPTRPTLVKALAQVAEELGQLLIGMSVMEIEAARARMERAGGWAAGGLVTMAISTLDVALWDAKGKIVGQPLYRLLGGHRDRTKAYASDGLWRSLPVDALAQAARRHVSEGHDTIKLRVGGEATPAAEAARIRDIREAVGLDVRIMVDAAQSWNEADAMAVGRALQEAGIIWLEDPVFHTNVAGLAHLAQVLDVPIAAGENLYGVEPFQRTFDARAVDFAIIDLARVGGITPWMKVAAMAQARGIPVAGHVLPEMHVHLLSAVPNGHLVEAMPRSELILKSRLKLEDGHLLAPQAPGLGVELDEAACERYRVG